MRTLSYIFAIFVCNAFAGQTPHPSPIPLLKQYAFLVSSKRGLAELHIKGKAYMSPPLAYFANSVITAFFNTPTLRALPKNSQYSDTNTKLNQIAQEIHAAFADPDPHKKYNFAQKFADSLQETDFPYSPNASAEAILASAFLSNVTKSLKNNFAMNDVDKPLQIIALPENDVLFAGVISKDYYAYEKFVKRVENRSSTEDLLPLKYPSLQSAITAQRASFPKSPILPEYCIIHLKNFHNYDVVIGQHLELKVLKPELMTAGFDFDFMHYTFQLHLPTAKLPIAQTIDLGPSLSSNGNVHRNYNLIAILSREFDIARPMIVFQHQGKWYNGPDLILDIQDELAKFSRETFRPIIALFYQKSDQGPEQEELPDRDITPEERQSLADFARSLEKLRSSPQK